DDVRTIFTDCDNDNKLKWVVAVPKTEKSCGDKEVPPPESVPCDSRCVSGEFFDISTQNCNKCPKGTFSIGGGVRYTFDQSINLPSAFTVNSYSISDSVIDDSPFGNDDDGDDYSPRETGCDPVGWTITGNAIRSNTRPNCVSQLLLKTTLINRGHIKFIYNIVGDSYAFLEINSDCGDKKQRKKTEQYFLKSTGKGVWKEMGKDLGSSGQYRLSFYVVGIIDDHFPVSIKSIEVDDEGSSTCTAKMPCKESDFQVVYSECNEFNKARKTYVAVEPQICYDKPPISGDGDEIQCKPCNRGMYKLPNGTCSFCPDNTYSDGTLTDNMCFGNQSWIMNMEYLSSKIIGRTYSLLKLEIERGFKTTVITDYYGTLYFKFSMTCSLPCELYLTQSDLDSDELSIINSWQQKANNVGQNNTIEYQYSIRENSSVAFTWIFGRMSSSDKISKNDDIIEIRIYEIRVTNTMDGGADSCVACLMMDNNQQGCRACQPGFIISNGTCVRCKENTIVSSNIRSEKYIDSQIQKCVQCPNNTISNDGIKCIINCKQMFGTQFNYDLSRISRVEFQSSKLFSELGYGYFHMFNASICGSSISRCVANETSKVGKDRRISVESRLCRTLLTTPSNNLTNGITVDDFGEELVNVSLWSDLKTFPLLKTDNNLSDLTLVFRASSSKSACNERITFLSLRCDNQVEKATKYKVQYPADSNCVSGTCDGCTFRFLLRTIDACPMCEESSGYDIFRGECHLGKQQIRKTPKSYCTGRLQARTDIQKCSLLTLEIEIVIFISLMIAIILCVSLICCWKKNRTLQYRYMQLIENVNPDDDNPVDNVCSTALDDDDDEEIDMKKQSKAKKLMNVFSKALKKNDNQLREDFLLTSEA
ncbi:unnamed protein product, partial [Didymodactylos carnosus]